jgi:hypothetical protein
MMVEDAEWWFNLWVVRRNRRNEKKEEECGWWRMKSCGFICRLWEVMRRGKRIVDGRGCRVVVQLVDYEKEWEEGRRIEDAEWWFNLCIVRRNEKKEEDVDGRGWRVVVHLVDC